ncbi:hypothetical protein QBZ16_000529 [Prototheca wickerhamii]|uniref:Pectate lyase superfamily protein domain-containing protein n=1 Tax=Prototheca wickerhamii TaxID=3111 RepID=A0AAD9IP48_PROWI|nr:hypothetical protein QBZ16_000529 [Prototheca wickerhamii]
MSILEAAKSEPDEPDRHQYFSAPALAARQEILEGAAQLLSDRATEARYRQRVREGSLEETVPGNLVSGALLLLLETGCAEDVARRGRAWLEEGSGRVASKKDIAVAVAKAHCDMAADCLGRSGPVSRAVAELEAAQAILKTWAVSGQFQAEIAGAISSLGPDLALETIERAEEASAEERQTALRLAADAVGSGRVDAVWKTRFLTSLRPAEQLGLHAAVGDAACGSSTDFGALAAAMIGAAVAGGPRPDPAGVARAQRCLAAAEALAEEEARAAPSGAARLTARERRQKLSITAAVSHLLLADPEACKQALGWGTGPGGGPADRQVAAFVRSNSPDPDDPLPGLCALAEHWIDAIAVPLVDAPRGTAPFALEAWFAAPEVQAYFDGPKAARTGTLAETFADPELLAVGANRQMPRLTAAEPRQQGAAAAHEAAAEGSIVSVDNLPELQLDRKSLRWGRVAFVAAVVLGMPAALLWRAGVVSLPFVPGPSQTAQSAPLPSMDQATELVQRWQAVRAAVLGPKHLVSELSSLLNGPLLTRWEDKAKELASSHVAFECVPKAVNVVAVKHGPNGNPTILADVEETLRASNAPDASSAMRLSRFRASLKALGADSTGSRDVSAVLSSATSDGNWDASGIIQVTAGTYRISKSLSISKPVNFASGAKFNIDAGVTVTFNSPVTGPSSSQLFAGAGTVTFGYGVQATVLVEWFGAKGNGATDDTAAINRALASSMGYRNVYFGPNKVYIISGPLTVAPNVVVEASSSSTVRGSSQNVNGFVFTIPTNNNGGYRGRHVLPRLDRLNQAIVFSDAGIVDVYSAAISNVQSAVQLQSTRAKGAGRQVTQVRVEVGSVTNAMNGIVFFDKIGKAVMQGNSVNFGSFVDNSGVSQALVYFKTTGGAEAYWDSNDFTFGTVTPRSSSSSNTFTLIKADTTSLTVYRQNVRMQLPTFHTDGVTSNNFNNFVLKPPSRPAVAAMTARNSRSKFNGNVPLTHTTFGVVIRNAVPSKDPRTGKTPANGPTWPRGEARRFYIYHGLAQNGQMVFATVPTHGTGCLPSGIAITNIFDRSSTTKYEVEIVAVACKTLSMADIRSGKININFNMLIGSVGTA